jgi:hypothetical protein
MDLEHEASFRLSIRKISNFPTRCEPFPTALRSSDRCEFVDGVLNCKAVVKSLTVPDVKVAYLSQKFGTNFWGRPLGFATAKPLLFLFHHPDAVPRLWGRVVSVILATVDKYSRWTIVGCGLEGILKMAARRFPVAPQIAFETGLVAGNHRVELGECCRRVITERFINLGRV